MSSYNGLFQNTSYVKPPSSININKKNIIIINKDTYNINYVEIKENINLFFIVKNNNIINIPTIKENEYYNFSIINSSGKYIILKANNNELIYNSLNINISGENTFSLAPNQLCSLHNFYRDNINSWVIKLS